MGFVHVIALLCMVSQLYSRVVVGDANYYFKVLRLADPSTQAHYVASRAPSLDRNCFFSPVQCMLSNGKQAQEI